jgi:hypothetical protein
MAPLFPMGIFAGYLFKGQRVNSIAVDGADRKWVATKNGVFSYQRNREKIIYQFTEDNSPLLSSDVKKITIDGKTVGSIFCYIKRHMFISQHGKLKLGKPMRMYWVFPNPVPPGFTGTIAIRGLVNNAIVKITELDGRLVYQTRALGGQAVWDGRNYKGQKISSGVYLVLVNDDGKKKE